jgi:AcrR family transcriptional regulator
MHHVFRYDTYAKMSCVARLTRVESKERTRQRLLAAGERAFRRQGFHDASIDDIAETAGFTRGAFYASFRDKADLFLTIIENRRSQDMADIEDALAASDDDEDQLSALQRWFDLTSTDDELDLANAEFWPHAIRDRHLRRRLEARQRATREVITRGVQRYLDASGMTMTMETHHLAGLILAIGDGIRTQRRLDPDGLPPDAFTTAVVHLCTSLFS